MAHDVILKAESLYGNLCLNILPSENDAVVIFYVTGYCCRSLAKSNRCEKCREVTIAEVDQNQDVDIASRLFTELNRSGLWKHTPKMFDIACLCWKIFSELCDSGLRNQFLKGIDQRELFKKIVSTAFYDGSVMSPWSVCAMCSNGHNILEGIAFPFFNCMSKNLVRDTSESEALRSVRKIRKLTGKS